MCYYGDMDILKLCINYGADPLINSYSPLIMSIEKGHSECVRLLLDLGSIFNPEWSYNTNNDVINVLIDYGYEINNLVNRDDK